MPDQETNEVLDAFHAEIKKPQKCLEEIEKAKTTGDLKSLKDLLKKFAELDAAFALVRSQAVELECLIQDKEEETRAGDGSEGGAEAEPAKGPKRKAAAHPAMATKKMAVTRLGGQPALLHAARMKVETAKPDVDAEEDKFEVIKVWFGTNRKILVGGKTLEAGTEIPTIPRKYGKKGKDRVFFQHGRPRKTWKTQGTAPGSEPVMVGSVNVHLKDQRGFIGRQNFMGTPRYIEDITVFGTGTQAYEDLFKDMKLDSEKDVLIFIHGFNVSFEAAANTAATLQKEIGIPTAFLSWASMGSLTSYATDEACIGACEKGITEFLFNFLQHKEGQRVHVIAHSMGNRGLARAIQRIQLKAEQQQHKQTGFKFGRIIFAAPDVDSQLFMDLAKTSFRKELAEGYTLYATDSDKALGVSGVVHSQPRAGRHLPFTIVPGGIVETVTVDLNNSLFDLNHSYFVESDKVIRDLNIILGRTESRDQGLKEGKEGHFIMA